MAENTNSNHIGINDADVREHMSDREIEQMLLKKRLRALEAENLGLKKENQRIQEALSKKN